MAYNNFGGYGGAGSQKRAKRMMSGDYMGQQSGDGIYNFSPSGQANAAPAPAAPANLSRLGLENNGKPFNLKDRYGQRKMPLPTKGNGYGGFGNYQKPTPVGPTMPLPPDAPPGGGATPGGGTAPGLESVQPMPPPRAVDERRAEADLRRQARRDARDARRGEREDLKRPQSPPAEAIGGGPVETAPAANQDRRALAPEESLPPGAKLMATRSNPPQYFYENPETGESGHVPPDHPAILADQEERLAEYQAQLRQAAAMPPQALTPEQLRLFSWGPPALMPMPPPNFSGGQPVPMPGRFPPPPQQGYNYFDGSRRSSFGNYGRPGMNPFTPISMRGMGGMRGMGNQFLGGMGGYGMNPYGMGGYGMNPYGMGGYGTSLYGMPDRARHSQDRMNSAVLDIDPFYGSGG